MSVRNVSAQLSHCNEELHHKIDQNKTLKCYTCSLIVLNGNRTLCSSMVLSEASDKIYHFTVYHYCWNMLKMNTLCYRKGSRHMCIRIVVSSMNFFKVKNLLHSLQKNI